MRSQPVRSLAVRTLLVLATVMAVGELGSAVIIWREAYADAVPAASVVFAALFLVGAWLLQRGRVGGGAVLVGVLSLVEVVSYPGWTRHDLLDWTYQSVSALVALVSLLVTIAVLVGRRRTPATV